ncbi:MAG: DUF3618 domain-containing protein [Propionibacteriaceae bacterium]|jgi:hypothetical protein|nr:DUF3618 domain-containing protein [Propionibacteriaceae bacterium]
MGKQRTTAEIEAEIAAARERLASNVESLVNQVHPKAVAQRGLRQARDFVDDKVDVLKQKAAPLQAKVAPLKSEVVAADGSWRTDRVAMIAGGVAAVIILIGLLRKILSR